jgi:hypothetical protein
MGLICQQISGWIFPAPEIIFASSATLPITMMTIDSTRMREEPDELFIKSFAAQGRSLTEILSQFRIQNNFCARPEKHFRS